MVRGCWMMSLAPLCPLHQVSERDKKEKSVFECFLFAVAAEQIEAIMSKILQSYTILLHCCIQV